MPKRPSIEDVIAFVEAHALHGVDKKKLTKEFHIKGQEARKSFKDFMRELVIGGHLHFYAKKYFPAQKEKEGEHKSNPVHKKQEAFQENPKTLMGTLKVRPSAPALFLPLAKKLDTMSFIAPNLPQDMCLNDGDVVLAEIVHAGDARKEGTVHILERVSDTTRGSEITVALHNHQIPHTFPAEVLQEASALKGLTKEEMHGREDLRKTPLVTIDGEDAKDFDDAVFAEPWETPKIKGGFHIIVAIADVAHYVKEHSTLDKEAFTRGNSSYFPGFVVPMLPEELSNNLCSLRPKEDRPTLVAHLYIDAKGKLHKYSFSRAVIHSHARLTYTEVQRALEGDVSEQLSPLMETTVNPLYSAYKALMINREKRGALDFEMPETSFVLSETGEPIGVEKRDRFDAHRLIEEIMILANVAAASQLKTKGAPCLYRIHPEPSTTKLDALQLAFKETGIKLNVSGSITPALIQGAINKLNPADKEDFGIVILRAQEQARYDAQNIGHFGLALQNYAHFTSPIRRYSDLIVHRSLIHTLRLEGHKNINKPTRLDEKAEHLCITERRSQKAEWDVRDRLTVRLYHKKLNESFTAVINTITNFGMFVSIEEGLAEGLLPLRTLSDDHYIYNEKTNKLYGKRTKKVYALGDEIEVILTEADERAGRLTFMAKGMPESKRHIRKPQHRRRKK